MFNLKSIVKSAIVLALTFFYRIRFFIINFIKIDSKVNLGNTKESIVKMMLRNSWFCYYKLIRQPHNEVIFLLLLFSQQLRIAAATVIKT